MNRKLLSSGLLGWHEMAGDLAVGASHPLQVVTHAGLRAALDFASGGFLDGLRQFGAAPLALPAGSNLVEVGAGLAGIGCKLDRPFFFVDKFE